MSSVPESPTTPTVSDANAKPTAPRRTFWRSLKSHLWRKRVVLPVVILLILTAAAWRYRVTRTEYRFARGEEAVRQRDWNSVDELAKRLEASGQPDHARLLRAEGLYARKLPDLALAECNEIRDQGAIRLPAATLAGKCLLELGELKEARRTFEFVLGEEPDNVDAHRGLAAVAYDMGQMHMAIVHLKEIIRLDLADSRPHRLLANIYRDMGNNDEAEAEFREALRIGGQSDVVREEVQFELAENLVKQSKFTDALAVLDEAAAGDSEPPAMVAVRGQALRGSGQRAEAIALADRAIAAHPDGVFYLLRGQLFLDDGDAVAAIPQLEQAARLYRRPYQPYVLLTQAYAAAGRKSDAEAANRRAEELRRDMQQATELSQEAMANPWDPMVRLKLAEVFDRLREPALAAMWRKAAAEVQRQKR